MEKRRKKFIILVFILPFLFLITLNLTSAYFIDWGGVNLAEYFEDRGRLAEGQGVEVTSHVESTNAGETIIYQVKINPPSDTFPEFNSPIGTGVVIFNGPQEVTLNKELSSGWDGGDSCILTEPYSIDYPEYRYFEENNIICYPGNIPEQGTTVTFALNIPDDFSEEDIEANFIYLHSESFITCFLSSAPKYYLCPDAMFTSEMVTTEVIPGTPEHLCDDTKDVMFEIEKRDNSEVGVFNPPTDSPYNYQICYNEIFGISGDGDRTCDGVDNLIIGIKGGAFGGKVQTPESYMEGLGYTPLCYSDLICRSVTTGNCDTANNEQEIIRLLQETDSRVSLIDADAIKICCTSPRSNPEVESDNLYWADMNKVRIGETEGVFLSPPNLGDTILMIGEETGISEGTQVTFSIYGDDTFDNDDVRTGDDAIIGVIKNGRAIGKWKISQEDLDKAGDAFGGDEEFIFKIQGQESNKLKITSNPNNALPYTEITSPIDTNYIIEGQTTALIDFKQKSSDADDDLKIIWEFGDGTTAEFFNCLTTGNCNTTHQYSSSGTKTIYLHAQEMPPRTQSDFDSTKVYVHKLGYNVFAEINPPESITLDPGIYTLDGTGSYVSECFDVVEDCITAYPTTCYVALPTLDGTNYFCSKVSSPTLTYEWKLNDMAQTDTTSTIEKTFVEQGRQDIDLKVSYTTPSGETKFGTDGIYFYLGRGGAFCSNTADTSEWIDYSDGHIQTSNSLNDCFGAIAGIGTIVGGTDCCPNGRPYVCNNGVCESGDEEYCRDFEGPTECVDGTSTIAQREIEEAGGFCGDRVTGITLEVIDCLCAWDGEACIATQTSTTYGDDENGGFDRTNPSEGGTCSWASTSWIEDCDISGQITAEWRAIPTGTLSPYLASICNTKSKEIPCQTTVKLNFFTTLNLIIAILLIITIYSFIRYRRK
jgi:hypothetical protein